MQSDSADAIPFATIKLKNKQQTFLANENGFAHVKAHSGDTLQISAIGFFPIEIEFNLTRVAPIFRIHLLAKNINLKEVTIKGIATKEELKLAILRMRIEEKQKDIPGIKTFHGPIRKQAAGVMSPISMIYESEWAKKSRAKKWSKSLIMPQIK